MPPLITLDELKEFSENSKDTIPKIIHYIFMERLYDFEVKWLEACGEDCIVRYWSFEAADKFVETNYFHYFSIFISLVVIENR
eukprot:UN14384